MSRKTAFDRYVDNELKKPGTRAAYEKARTEIETVDQIVRTLDAARIDAGVSKADLARSISAKPEIVRRLLTSEASNPTLATVAKLASALGLTLQLVPERPKPAKVPTPARRAAPELVSGRPKPSKALSSRKTARSSADA
jgi:ribosome-binding protein aMBF1 (putative translation factor)